MYSKYFQNCFIMGVTFHHNYEIFMALLFFNSGRSEHLFI